MGFEKLSDAVLEDIVINRYQSNRSGLCLFIANVKGPLVYGYFTLATEPSDNSGLPHTLEHLVFMGSRKYPHKEILDILANRCLAQGTNAWTSKDNTSFTINTVGPDGLLNILPVYLDHIINPTLTHNAFLTEVFHINGKGEAAGVVYSELEDGENTESNLMDLYLHRTLYPSTSNYRWDSGGTMESLRNEATNETIKQYHERFYSIDNLCIIIVGEIDPGPFLQVIEEFECKNQSDNKLYGDSLSGVRPWSSEISEYQNLHEPHYVDFPSEDELTGSVMLAWRGPHCYDLYVWQAGEVILNYLTDSSSSPISQHLIEIDNPYCTRSSFSQLYYRDCAKYIKFYDVPEKKLDSLHDKALALITSINENVIDMKRISDTIERLIRDRSSYLEDEPQEISDELISHFIYGNGGPSLQSHIDDVGRLRMLLKEDSHFWVKIFHTLLDLNKVLIIIGRPSKGLARQLAEERANRIEERKCRFGVNGLEELQQAIDDAVDGNDEEIPDALLELFPIPNVENIKFHRVETASLPLPELPFPVDVTSIDSKFVTVHLLIDTSGVDSRMLWLIPIWTELMFESDVKINGVLVPYSEVVDEINNHLVEYSCDIGFGGSRFYSGSSSQAIVIMGKTTRDQTYKALEIVRNVLVNSKFAKDRLKTTLTKVKNCVSSSVRDIDYVCEMLSTELRFQPGSTKVVNNAIKQGKLMDHLDKDLDIAVKLINDLHSVVLKSNMYLHLCGNLDQNLSTENIRDTFQIQSNTTSRCDNNDNDILKSISSRMFRRNAEFTGVIYGLQAAESSYLLASAPVFTDRHHPDVAPLLVLFQYLSSSSGPLWNEIRGSGLAYNVGMELSVGTGLLTLWVYQSTQLVQAYKAAQKVVLDVLDDEDFISDEDVGAAKSNLVYSIVEKESTPSSAGYQHLNHLVNGVSLDYSRQLLHRINSVTVDEVNRVANGYLNLVFQPESSWCIVCTHADKVNEIQTALGACNRPVTVIDDLYTTYDIDFDAVFRNE